MKFTIRKKLLLVSFTVLAIPWIGLEYIRELERYLRDALETSLLDFSLAMSAPLQERPALFPERFDTGRDSIYVHTLDHPIQLDGYTHDWQAYLDWSDSFSIDGLSYRLLLSRHEHYYYILLRVNDNDLVYRQSENPDAVDNDYVELIYADPYGDLNRLFFSPSAPGSIRPYRVLTFRDEYGIDVSSTQFVTNINAEWQQVDDGYTLEIAIPISLVGDRFSMIVTDVDDANSRDVVHSLGTAGVNSRLSPGTLVSSSPEIKELIRGYGQSEGRRIWILDHAGRVLANSGSLENPNGSTTAKSIYSLLLPSITGRFKDDLAGASRLQSGEVRQALKGNTHARWRASPDGKAIIISAAAPVKIEDEIRGVVVVEQTTSGIQIQQRRAMADLLNRTLVVFLIVTIVLLLYATRLSFRIRQLGRQADASIDEHGRVVHTFKPSNAEDEIGELSRNYAAMIDRLREYNIYLENMSGRLSHEIRTPITVVQTSLEHLQVDADSRQYLQRAQEGIERLQVLVTRLSEAARLEQALQSSDKQSMDIGELLANCVQGYESAYPDVSFTLQQSDATITHELTPDLFVQMLDKLIANAVDFHEQGTAIVIELVDAKDQWQLSVANQGPLLPDTMEDQLFTSMVSIRDSKSEKEPHLGLGLYIVRLVAEFHGGEIRAENNDNKDGVCFRLSFKK